MTDPTLIRNRAARVRARTCDPGTDHEAYELARDTQTLLAENEELRRDLSANERSDDARLAIAEKALRDIQSMAEQFDTPRDASRVRVFIGDLRHLVSRGLGEYRG